MTTPRRVVITIPLKTDRWDVAIPGFTEIDRGAHCGSFGDGEFVHSLDVTDIATTWVETAAVLGKSQLAVQTALDGLRQALPSRLGGIDSDNGSEFINQHLWDDCQAQEIRFTRGRPYKKDDNAHIEQKDWTHVRKLLGYVRDDGVSESRLAELRRLPYPRLTEGGSGHDRLSRARARRVCDAVCTRLAPVPTRGP